MSSVLRTRSRHPGQTRAGASYLNQHQLDENSIIHREDFEAFGESGALERLGWSVDQGGVSFAKAGYEGACLRINPSPNGKFGQATLSFQFPPELPVLFSDFWIKPVAFLEGPEEFVDVSGSVTGAFRLVKEQAGDRSIAALYVLNGNGERGGKWLDTGTVFELDAEGRPLHWLRLTFRQEFSRPGVADSKSRWDLWVDGRLAAVDLGYFDDQAIDPGRITLLGHRSIPLYLDSLTVSSANPLFADEDVNGRARPRLDRRTGCGPRWRWPQQRPGVPSGNQSDPYRYGWRHC